MDTRMVRASFTALVVLMLMSGLTMCAESTPGRIVTLAPACAEVVSGLGWAEMIVGVSDYTDYPESTRALARVGSYVNPSLEAIVALEPDLVVATSDGNPPPLLSRLRDLGIDVFVLDLRTWDSIRATIRQFGRKYGAGDRADAVVGEMNRVTGCITRATSTRDKPRVLMAWDLDPAISPGKNAFTNELVRLAGGDSVTEGAPTEYPRLTIEQVIALKPDVIVGSTMDPSVDIERWRSWLGRWNVIPAIANERLHMFDGTNLDRPSQRVVFGVRSLAEVLHPGALVEGACLPDRTLLD